MAAGNSSDERATAGSGSDARDEQLERERAVLHRAEQSLDAMRRRAELALAQAEHDAHLDTAFDAAAIHHELRTRVAALAPSKAALTFGRIDSENEDSFYVGRRHVEDEQGEPVVIDWRAGVAAPFYRATWADPFGLVLRRRFAVDGSELVGLFDERFGDPDAHAEGGGVPDPLLIELERSRTGEMRDIVATIQAEQDVVIRSPKDQVTLVQGGPGTGKTAVGLHRAAYLLYEHRAELSGSRLLVVGPNPLFLAYISQVLPSLGEVAVTQATITSLLARYPVRADESDEVAALKGDPRMASVINGLIDAKLRFPTDDVTIMTAFGSARFAADGLADRVNTAKQRALPTNTARDLLRQQLLADAWREFSSRTQADPGVNTSFVDDLNRQRGFTKLLSDCWPTLSGPTLIRELLSNRRTLAAAADGLLSTAEQALLVRRKAASAAAEQWTRADLSLLDEADARTSGVSRTFGHIVVDEAQDLTTMELRAVARRSPTRSITLLGDLAQSTAAGGQHDWHAVLDALAQAQPFETRDFKSLVGEIKELELGYRVPEAMLEYANRLLPEAAPLVNPSRSVRVGGRAPNVISVASRHDVIAQAVASARTMTETWTAVGIIAPDDHLDDLALACADGDLAALDARGAATMDAALVLLGPRQAKGLEFDAVVLVEPAGVVATTPDRLVGLRLLYIALTRAVQEVVVVHHQQLPEVLR